jgi:GDP/UDP-N,N'-diacetylbacillosamine 2-epimerase (hydrolysing)
MAGSVINCAPERSSIVSALARLFSEDFREELKTVKNPYGNGGASDKIVKILERESFDDLLKKEFFDIPHN